MARKVDMIILHCSASDLPNQDVKMINEWHVARGFKKIGYHFFIQKNGYLEPGRSLDEVGSHCKGKNKSSIGICLAGLTGFSVAQFDTLRVLLTTLKDIFPDATVHGHHEFNEGKTCPVFDYTELVRFWKKTVRDE